MNLSRKLTTLSLYVTLTAALPVTTLALPTPIAPTITVAITRPTIIPAAPSLAATAYLLMDFNSGHVLVEKDANTRKEPASLTKIMTTYVVDQEIKNGKIKLDDNVLISENAWRTGGSRTFLEVGKQFPVEELMKGAIIQSGNDASVALAEHVAGTESGFAELMNHYAKQIGMNNTHFVNATGLPDPEHYTTAHDLALLTQALIHDFPESYKVYSEKWHTINGIRQPNRNRLLWRDSTVDGVKTGHTDSAGYCLVASSLRNNMRLISVVLGANDEESRAKESQQLLSYGFRFYETKRLFVAGETLSQPRVWMGSAKKINLGLEDDLYVTVPQGQYNQLQAVMNIQSEIKAPATAGTSYGQLEVSLNDSFVTQKSLIALSTVERGSLWERFTDYISMFFHKLLKKKVTV